MSILQIKQIVKSVCVAVYNQHCLHLPPLIQAQYFLESNVLHVIVLL